MSIFLYKVFPIQAIAFTRRWLGFVKSLKGIDCWVKFSRKDILKKSCCTYSCPGNLSASELWKSVYMKKLFNQKKKTRVYENILTPEMHELETLANSFASSFQVNIFRRQFLLYNFFEGNFFQFLQSHEITSRNFFFFASTKTWSWENMILHVSEC